MKRAGSEPIAVILAFVVGAILAMLVCVLVEPAVAQTLQRDQSGAVIPCQWQSGPTGLFNTCGENNPLPVTGGAATTATSDPSGWGRRWITSSVTFTATDNEVAALFASSGTAYLFERTNIAQVHQSANRGVSFTAVAAASPAPALESYQMFRTSTGRYVAGASLLNIWASASPVRDWVQSTVTGPPAATTTIDGGFAQQGATILAAASDNAGNQGWLCLSTNDAASFTCVQPTSLQVFNANPATPGEKGGRNITSPAANIWLTIDNDGRLYRSTNDGVTFASVTTLGASTNTYTGVLCLSATVCVVWVNTQIFRSSDAGLSWSSVYTSANPIRTGVSFGSNIAVLAGPASNGAQIYRTADLGVSWENFVAPATPTCITGFWSSQSVQSGAGLLAWECGNPGGAGRLVLYSPIVGAGQTGVVGASGVQWDINSAGAGGVYQGAGNAGASTSAAPWLVAPIQAANLFNGQSVSAANTAVARTITGVAAQRAHLYNVSAYCSAGTANLTVTDGGTTIWSTPAGAVGAGLFDKSWSTGLTGTTAATMVITLGACGAGNTGTLSVQADQW